MATENIITVAMAPMTMLTTHVLVRRLGEIAGLGVLFAALPAGVEPGIDPLAASWTLPRRSGWRVLLGRRVEHFARTRGVGLRHDHLDLRHAADRASERRIVVDDAGADPGLLQSIGDEARVDRIGGAQDGVHRGRCAG